MNLGRRFAPVSFRLANILLGLGLGGVGLVLGLGLGGLGLGLGFGLGGVGFGLGLGLGGVGLNYNTDDNPLDHKLVDRRRNAGGSAGSSGLSKSTRTFSSEPRAPKIYTKGGDKGRSALFTGERRSKADSVFEALGSVDELSCHVGLCLEHCKDAAKEPWNAQLVEQLREIQCLLQDVGSSVATPRSSARDAHLKRVTFSEGHSRTLEVWIDVMTDELPPLKNFILPSGGKLAATLHLARSVCRRCERSLVPLLETDELENGTYVFLNRLSDYFFTAARFAAMKTGAKEEIYLRPKER